MSRVQKSDNSDDLGWARRGFRAVFYFIVKNTAFVGFLFIYRTRGLHRERMPKSGPLLVASNHQSHFDPPCIGGIAPRRLSYIAQSGLFKFKPFGWAIESLGSIPINQEAGDAGAIREVIRRLDQGEAVLIFPEGTRCEKGEIEEFKRGVMLLVRRAKCAVQPVAIEGSFGAWPRFNKFPKLLGHRILVNYGTPISYDELMKDGNDAAMERLRREITLLREELKDKMIEDQRAFR